MALFIQRTGDGSNDHHDYQGQGGGKGNHTLEDVAEEVLNGMFCHYEPPDPRRVKKGKGKRDRGILRTPRAYRRPAASPSASSMRSKSEKSVRWSDGVEHTTPRKTSLSNFDDEDDSGSNIQCNVVSSCIDAGVEVGIVTSGQKKQAEKFLAQYERDQQKKNKEVVASIMKKRKEKSNQKRKDKFAVVFDDDGNLTSDRKGMPLPPPPPPLPPPSRNEKFIPELCGVGINCVDDDEQMQNLVKCYSDNRANPSKQYRRPRQKYDYDDDDETNSLISESDREEEDARSLKSKEKAKAKLKAKLRAKAKQLEVESDTADEEKEPAPPVTSARSPRRRFLGRSVAAVPKKTNEDDWDAGSNTGSNTASNTSSSFFRRRMWPSNRRKNNKFDNYHVEVGNEVASDDERPAVRRPVAVEKIKMPADMDPVEMDRFECMHKSNQLPSPRKSPLGLGFLRRSPRNTCGNDMCDWDESKPIVPLQATQSPIRQHVQSVQSSQPAPESPTSRGRSKSPSRRWRLGGFGRKQDARDPSPGPIRRTRSHSREDRRQDDSRGHSKSPAQNQIRGRQSLDPSSMNRARSKSPLTNQIRGRQSLDPSSMNRGRSKSPLRSSLKGRRSLDVSNESYQSFASDQAQQDAMERQSFITDHRRGFEGGAPAPPPPQMIPYRSPMRPVTPQMQAQMRQTNPQMQAQIHAQMQGYQHMQPGYPQSGSPGRPQMRPGQPPMQPGHPLLHPAHPLNRPVMRDDLHGPCGPCGFDDRSERQSLITAHRQGFDAPPPPPPAPVMRRSAASTRSQDDRLERQSDITAHRQSFESQGRMRGRSKSAERARRESAGNDRRSARSKSPERRSRSPYRRSHSFEQEFGNDTNQGPVSRRGRSASPNQGPVNRGRSRERTNDEQQIAYMNANQVMQQRQSPSAYSQAIQQRQSPSAYQQVMQQPQPPVAYEQTMQQQYLPPTPGEPLVEKKEVAPEQQPEMSWEEKTRLAWAVLRGDAPSSLTVETPKTEAPKTEDGSDYFPAEGILRRQSSSESKKVTFGQDEIRLTPSREQLSQAEYFEDFEDDQDENQSISSEVRKKKVFRGTRLIAGLFGRKAKNSPSKVKLSNSRSLDLTATATMSQDNSEGMMNSRSMESDYGMYTNQVPMQSANIGMYNGQMPVQSNYGMSPNDNGMGFSA